MSGIPGQRYLVYVDIENDELRKLFNRTWTDELFYHAIKSPRFKEVYKEPPSQNYRYEWAITTRLSPGIDEEHSWILFSLTGKEKMNKEKKTKQNLNGFPSEVVDLMNKVRPEIELVYKAIKEGEGFNNLGEMHDNARMEDALNYFEEYEYEFEIIKREDLQNIKIFNTSTEKHTRKIKGELLKTIIRRHGLGDYAYGELFKEYQKNK
jgi:hypothetical protein